MAFSHLLQPKSSIQICRLGFLAAKSRCCFSVPGLKEEFGLKEAGIMTVDTVPKESPRKNPTFISPPKEVKYTRLTDLFREHKVDLKEIAEDKEGTQQSKEALSDVLLDFYAKNKNSDSKCLSQPNDLLPVERASDSHSEELPAESAENDKQRPPTFLDGISELSNDPPSKNHMENTPDINELIGILRVKKHALSSSTGSKKNKVPVKESSSNGSSVKISKSDNTRDFRDGFSKTGNAEMGKSGVKPGDLRDGFSKSKTENEEMGNSRVKPGNTRDFRDGFSKTENEEMGNSRVKPGDFKDGKKRTKVDEEMGNSGVKPGDFKDGKKRTKVDEEMGNSEVNHVDFTFGKGRTNVLVPTGHKDDRQLNRMSFSREASDENRVLVRFIHNSITEEKVLSHFQTCGEIVDAEFHNAGVSQFKTAYIYFKTKKELKNALKKHGSCLIRYIVTVESLTSSMKSVEIPTLNFTVDLDIPTALVKNPTRTVKIEQLTCEISSYHIKEALAFCGSNISGYFLGPAHSVAYVEFETEIGKERALAKQSINVCGRHLKMFRVDPPRTTVVRISIMQPLDSSKILSVCKALGGVRLSLQRNYYTLDVHFELAEWPNMLKILNRLNGYEIEGRRLQAEPASVFPPDVLIALLNQPDERKLLRAMAHGLLHKIGENKVSTSAFSPLHEFLR